MSDQLLDQLPKWLHVLTVLVLLCLGVIIPRRSNGCRHYQFNKRFCRFSLRTLLIATTLVAVGLGFVGFTTKLGSSRAERFNDGPVTSLPSPEEWDVIIRGRK